jgi:hypothetical protein
MTIKSTLDIGTDPHVASSSLRITAIAPGQLSLTTVSNKLYRIEYCSDLASNSWSTLTNGVAGTGAMIQILDPGAAGVPRRFYRTRVP